MLRDRLLSLLLLFILVFIIDNPYFFTNRFFPHFSSSSALFFFVRQYQPLPDSPHDTTSTSSNSYSIFPFALNNELFYSSAPSAAPSLSIPSVALVTLYTALNSDELLPWYANYWAQSCGPLAPEIHCIVILLRRIVRRSESTGTDTASPDPSLVPVTDPHLFFSHRLPDDTIPTNVHVYEISLSQFSFRLQNITGHASINPQRWDKRKLADFKPLYGSLFTDILKPYKYWGWIEIDLVLGNIKTFLYFILQGKTTASSFSSSEASVPSSSSSSSSSSSFVPKYPLYLRNDNRYSSSLPEPDIVTLYLENSWGEGTTAGQFTIFRNIPIINNVRKIIKSSSRNWMITTHKHANADERMFGEAVYQYVRKNVSFLRNENDESDTVRSLKFTAVRSGFGDHDLCLGPGNMGWVYYWEKGTMLRKWGCKEGAEVEEGMY